MTAIIRGRYTNKVICKGTTICTAAEKNRADLRDADLLGATLCDANLRDANLRNANLVGANLMGADLRRANLMGANLRDADLRGADLRGADLRGADLRDADFRRANLCKADLMGADLMGANLRYATLEGADLRGANLRDADFGGADLRKADLRDVTGIATREECIARLDEIRAHVIEHNDRLDMTCWHASAWSPTTEPAHACETAHCLAGWAQALSHDASIRQLHPTTAGVRLIPLAAGMFWETDERVRDWLTDREYATT